MLRLQVDTKQKKKLGTRHIESVKQFSALFFLMSVKLTHAYVSGTASAKLLKSDVLFNSEMKIPAYSCRSRKGNTTSLIFDVICAVLCGNA